MNFPSSIYPVQSIISGAPYMFIGSHNDTKDIFIAIPIYVGQSLDDTITINGTDQSIGNSIIDINANNANNNKILVEISVNGNMSQDEYKFKYLRFKVFNGQLDTSIEVKVTSFGNITRTAKTNIGAFNNAPIVSSTSNFIKNAPYLYLLNKKIRDGQGNVIEETNDFYPRLLINPDGNVQYEVGFELGTSLSSRSGVMEVDIILYKGGAAPNEDIIIPALTNASKFIDATGVLGVNAQKEGSCMVNIVIVDNKTMAVDRVITASYNASMRSSIVSLNATPTIYMGIKTKDADSM